MELMIDHEDLNRMIDMKIIFWGTRKASTLSQDRDL